MNATIIIKESEHGIQIVSSGIPLLKQKREGKWVVYCPVFQIFAYSKESEEAALDDFNESVDFFFRVHTEDGTLDEALAQFGWKSTVLSNKKIEPRFEFLGNVGNPQDLTSLQYAIA